MWFDATKKKTTTQSRPPEPLRRTGAIRLIREIRDPRLAFSGSIHFVLSHPVAAAA
jgi:hypothetical protein